MALDKKPRKGQHVIYNYKETYPVEYVVGKPHYIDDILNIVDISTKKHTQVIWMHADGPNPYLFLKEKIKCKNPSSKQNTAALI